jgi:pimeloyl-ACP methyl ester carboxylesterase
MEATASDGSTARAIDEGIGTPILVLHGGMGDSTTWAPVTDLLNQRFRTVRLHRRQYRLDLDGRPVTMAQEVEHVAAIARRLDKPLLVGHSSGAVLALEALVASPEAYSGAVLYEPPIVIGAPLGGPKLVPAREAFVNGKAGKAFAIFLRDVVGMNPLLCWAAGVAMGRQPELRAPIGRQLDDCDAIDALGVRLDDYAKLDLPILLMGGDRSPRHLGERLDALEHVLPRTRRLLMHGQGHAAEHRAPRRVARAIAEHYDEEVDPSTTRRSSQAPRGGRPKHHDEVDPSTTTRSSPRAVAPDAS